MKIKEKIKKMVPDKIFYNMIHLKRKYSIGGFRAISYSADGEDIVLEKLFRKRTKKGFFVDVGAFHPQYYSNTHMFHKKGWHGINIEPNPQAIKLFHKYRKSDINLELGISETPKTQTYYNFTYSGLNTFDQEHGERKGSKEWNKLIDKQEIQCLPLKDIFAKYLNGNVIDFIDIDVEGSDLEVLKSNDWNKYRPSVVLVEDKEFRQKLQESETFRYLTELDYKFYSYNNITLIMATSEFLSPKK